MTKNAMCNANSSKKQNKNNKKNQLTARHGKIIISAWHKISNKQKLRADLWTIGVSYRRHMMLSFIENTLGIVEISSGSSNWRSGENRQARNKQNRSNNSNSDQYQARHISNRHQATVN